MMLGGLDLVNSMFDEAGVAFRLTDDLSGGEAVYDIYAARKNGNPKDDYPSKLLPN